MFSKTSKYSYILFLLSIFLNVFFTSKLLQNLANHNSLTILKEQNIFNYGRIYNHQWTPLNPMHSKDFNLIDNIGHWGRDKTILLIGDSVDRRTVQWICSYKNETLSTGSYPTAEGWEDCAYYNGCPNICTLGEFNLTVVNAFLVGLNPDDFLRPRTGHHFPESQTLDPKRRLMEVYLPFLRDVLRRNPDVVVFNSGYLIFN